MITLLAIIVGFLITLALQGSTGGPVAATIGVLVGGIIILLLGGVFDD